MSEFIITSDQLERLIDGIEHDTGREISRVVERGAELPEVVRCRDCRFFATNIHGSYCKKSITRLSSPDGFCAWGERRADA